MIQIEALGFDDIEHYFQNAPKTANRAARLAINTISRRKGLTRIKKAMLNEIAFPSGYLSGDRLKATKFAKDTDLEAVITGRKRATSLARFTTGNPVVGSKLAMGVSVKVKRGKVTHLKKAWLVRLKRGASLTEDNYNVGLAVRLSPGEKLQDKNDTHKSWLVKDKVALLYGPSVDQVFKNIIADVSPDLLDDVGTEFFRQFERLSNG